MLLNLFLVLLLYQKCLVYNLEQWPSLCLYGYCLHLIGNPNRPWTVPMISASSTDIAMNLNDKPMKRSRHIDHRYFLDKSAMQLTFLEVTIDHRFVMQLIRISQQKKSGISYSLWSTQYWTTIFDSRQSMSLPAP